MNESISWNILACVASVSVRFGSKEFRRISKLQCDKIMRTGDGCNKGLGLGSRKGKYRLKQLEHAFGWNLMFAACVRFATQQPDTSGLVNHQVKYFAKANIAFIIFLHRRHGRFIVNRFKTVSLLSNRDSKVTKRIPSSSSLSSSVTSPSSTTRLD